VAGKQIAFRPVSGANLTPKSRSGKGQSGGLGPSGAFLMKNEVEDCSYTNAGKVLALERDLRTIGFRQ